MFTLVSEEKYTDGQIIFKDDNSGDWVYVIVSGSVEISKTIGEKKYVLDILKEGDAFGELGFIGGIKRTATATAVGETTVGVIDRDSLDKEFNKLSSDFRSILVAVIRRFKTMIDRVTEFTGRTEKRIPRTLSVSYKDKESLVKAYTDNISLGGLFIKTANPLAEGEMFFLKLQLPDFSEPMQIKCDVVWANKQGEGKDRSPGMGIKFLEMGEKDKQTFEKYIKSIKS